MNQPRYWRSERGLLAFLSLFSLAFIAASLYLQFYQHADPCALCILQRYAYLLIAGFTLLGAIAHGTRLLLLIQIFTLITAVGGMIAAERQIWLLIHPSLSCGFDSLQPILDQLPFAKNWPLIFKVEGLCDAANIPLLGLPLPTWSLLGYLLIFILIAYRCWKKSAA